MLDCNKDYVVHRAGCESARQAHCLTEATQNVFPPSTTCYGASILKSIRVALLASFLLAAMPEGYLDSCLVEALHYALSGSFPSYAGIC